MSPTSSFKGRDIKMPYCFANFKPLGVFLSWPQFTTFSDVGSLSAVLDMHGAHSGVTIGPADLTLHAGGAVLERRQNSTLATADGQKIIGGIKSLA